MAFTQRAIGVLKRFGPSNLKKVLWDSEFSGTHWDFIDDTKGDCVYPYLEKYAGKGDILDLGCGPGNTANEVANDSYRSYVGVDISAAALAKATKRTEANGRASKNRFECNDFINYQPKQQFDVILFRESMYHVPQNKVVSMLTHYAQFLSERGVFMVRMNVLDANRNNVPRLATMVETIESHFDVLEKGQHTDSNGNTGHTVITFRPRAAVPSAQRPQLQTR
jgi:2-polyprenyl-3-methyl-5-hydroxy-6-metoxy-1,4-benzoquinol methylase